MKAAGPRLPTAAAAALLLSHVAARDVVVPSDPCRRSQLPWDLDIISMVENVDNRRVHLVGEYRLQESGEERMDADLGSVLHNMHVKPQQQAEIRVVVAPSEVADVSVHLFSQTAAGDWALHCAAEGANTVEKNLFSPLDKDTAYRIQFRYRLLSVGGVVPECPTVSVELAVQYLAHAQSDVPCPFQHEPPLSKSGAALNLALSGDDGHYLFETSAASPPRALLWSGEDVVAGPYPIALPHLAGRRGEYILRITLRSDFIDAGSVGVMLTPQRDFHRRPFAGMPSTRMCGVNVSCVYGSRGVWKNTVVFQGVVSGQGTQDRPQLWLYRRNMMPPAVTAGRRACAPYYLRVSVAPVQEREDFLNCDALPLPDTLNWPGFFDPISVSLHFYQGVLLNGTGNQAVNFKPPQDMLLRINVMHPSTDVDVALFMVDGRRDVAVSNSFYGPEGIEAKLLADKDYRIVFTSLGAITRDPEKENDWGFFCEKFACTIVGERYNSVAPVGGSADVFPAVLNGMADALAHAPFSYIVSADELLRDSMDGDLPLRYTWTCCVQSEIGRWPFELFFESAVQVTIPLRDFVSGDTVARIDRVQWDNSTDLGESLFSTTSPGYSLLDAVLPPGRYVLVLSTGYLQGLPWESNLEQEGGVWPRQIWYNLDVRVQPVQNLGAVIGGDSCVDACFRRDEGLNLPQPNRCASDCDCDGNRTCSSGGYCGGDSGNCTVDISDRMICEGARPLPALLSLPEGGLHISEKFVVPGSKRSVVLGPMRSDRVLHVAIVSTDVPCTIALWRRSGTTSPWVNITEDHVQELRHEGMPWLMHNLVGHTSDERQQYRIEFEFARAPKRCDTFMMQLSIAPPGDDTGKCTLQSLPPDDLLHPSSPLVLPYSLGPEFYSYAGTTTPRKLLMFTLDEPADLKVLVRYNFKFQHFLLDICSCIDPHEVDLCLSCGQWRGEMTYNGAVISTNTLEKGTYVLKVLVANLRNQYREQCETFSLQVWADSVGRGRGPPLAVNECTHQFLPKSLNSVGLLEKEGYLHTLGDVRADLGNRVDSTEFTITQDSVFRMWVPPPENGAHVSTFYSLYKYNDTTKRWHESGLLDGQSGVHGSTLMQGTVGMYGVIKPGRYSVELNYVVEAEITETSFTLFEVPNCTAVRVELAIVPVAGNDLDKTVCQYDPAFPTEPLSHGHQLYTRPIPDPDAARFRHRLAFHLGDRGGEVDFDIRSNFETGGISFYLSGKSDAESKYYYPTRYIDRDFLKVALPGGDYELVIEDQVDADATALVKSAVGCNRYSMHMTMLDRGDATVVTAAPTGSPATPSPPYAPPTGYPTSYPTILQPACVDSSQENFNFCQYHDDGVCDDGGPFSFYDACPIGTDCVDCGFRDFWNASSPDYAYRAWHWASPADIDTVGDDNGGMGLPDGTPPPTNPVLVCADDDKALTTGETINDSVGIFYHCENVAMPKGDGTVTLDLAFPVTAMSLIRLWTHTHSGIDIDLSLRAPSLQTVGTAKTVNTHVESLGAQLAAKDDKYMARVSFVWEGGGNYVYMQDYTTCEEKSRLTAFDFVLIVVPAAKVPFLTSCAGLDSSAPLPTSKWTLSDRPIFENRKYAFSQDNFRTKSTGGRGPTTRHPVSIVVPAGTQGATVSVYIRFNLAVANFYLRFTAPNQSVPLGIVDADVDTNADDHMNGALRATFSGLQPQEYTLEILDDEDQLDLLAGSIFCIPFQYQLTVEATKFAPSVVSVDPATIEDLVPTRGLIVSIGFSTDVVVNAGKTPAEAQVVRLEVPDSEKKLLPVSAKLRRGRTLQVKFAAFGSEAPSEQQLQWQTRYVLKLDLAQLRPANDPAGKFAEGIVAQGVQSYKTVAGHCHGLNGMYCDVGGQCPFPADAPMCHSCQPGFKLEAKGFAGTCVAGPPPTPEPTSTNVGLHTPVPPVVVTPTPATPEPTQATPAPTPLPTRATPAPTPRPVWPTTPTPITPKPTDPADVDCSKYPYCGFPPPATADGSGGGGGGSGTVALMIGVIVVLVLGILAFCFVPLMRRNGWCGGSDRSTRQYRPPRANDQEEFESFPQDGRRAEV